MVDCRHRSIFGNFKDICDYMKDVTTDLNYFHFVKRLFGSNLTADRRVGEDRKEEVTKGIGVDSSISNNHFYLCDLAIINV